MADADHTSATAASPSGTQQVRGTPAAGVTVVVSTLDRPDRLARCLAALRGGTRQPAEVVVVDQGRSATAEHVVAEAAAAGLPVRRVPQDRRGLSLSQNTGVAVATSAVVAIVDDDCVPSDHWLEVVERAFDGRSADDPLLLTGRVLPLPPDGQRVAAVSTRDSTVRRQWDRPPLPWHIGTGGNFAVHRAAFRAVHGNDGRLGTGSAGRGGNDIDLFHRLVASGVTARYEPDLLVHHERSTPAEHASRRWSYGFGVGAMLGLWCRRRDGRTLPVLAGWIRLRLTRAYQRRRDHGPAEELRVLLGTIAGAVYGVRARPPEGTAP